MAKYGFFHFDYQLLVVKINWISYNRAVKIHLFGMIPNNMILSVIFF